MRVCFVGGFEGVVWDIYREREKSQRKNILKVLLLLLLWNIHVVVNYIVRVLAGKDFRMRVGLKERSEKEKMQCLVLTKLVDI